MFEDYLNSERKPPVIWNPTCGCFDWHKGWLVAFYVSSRIISGHQKFSISPAWAKIGSPWTISRWAGRAWEYSLPIIAQLRILSVTKWEVCNVGTVASKSCYRTRGSNFQILRFCSSSVKTMKLLGLLDWNVLQISRTKTTVTRPCQDQQVGQPSHLSS